MAVNLNKTPAATINLQKAAPSLTNIKAVLWWTASAGAAQFDLDVSAFILKADSKLIDENHFVFYNNLSAGGVTKSADERAGGTEELLINIPSIPATASEVSIIVTIFDADVRGQTFGLIQEAGIKILNADTNEEIAFYDLDETFSAETAVQVGSFCKTAEGFTFQGVGAGYTGLGLGDFFAGYSN